MANKFEEMSLEDLEAAIAAKKTNLQARRSELLAEVAEIDKALDKIDGGSGGGSRGGGKRGPRAKNSMTMREAITNAINKYKDGATLTQITESVKKQGYVSNAANFKNVVYQALYTNSDSFTKGDDGKYRLA